jgi:alpha-1,6-mannosyltransferase
MTPSSSPRTKLFILIPLTLGMIICFLLMTTLDHMTIQSTTYLTYFGIAFGLYLGALYVLWNVDLSATRGVLIGVFAAALLMRAPLWFTEPTLSTDIWRYLWDGHLVAEGINPYAERVDSPAFDSTSSPVRAQVQHRWMASPYPPAAQLTFGAVQLLIPDSPTAMQAVFTFFDLATGAVLISLLRRIGHPTGRAVLYIWNPLVVVEFAHSAHLDSLMTLFVMLAILWAHDNRDTRSMLAMTLATLTKFVPALLVPLFIRRWGWRRFLGYSALVILGFVPFLKAGLGLSPLSDGTGIFGASRIYLLNWQSNGGIFFWLGELLGRLGILEPFLVAKIIAFIALTILLIYILWMSRGKHIGSIVSIICGSALLIGSYVLLSPAVFPWYLCWLIAILPLLPVHHQPAWWPFTAGWVYFSGAVQLSYLFYMDPGNAHELEWVRQVEYLPLITLLLISITLWLNQLREKV